jgi:hypothetical protein
MMGSNYPPGVTGREYQIAGPDYERTVKRACRASDVEITLPNDDVPGLAHLALGILDGKILIRRGADPVARAKTRLQEIISAYENGSKIDVAECPFDGEVDVQGFQGVETWTCPLCGTDHEDDIEER